MPVAAITGTPRRSLARRTFIGMYALCLAFIAVLTAAWWWQGQRTALAQARAAMAWELQLAAERAGEDLSATLASLQRLAANPFFTNLLLDDGSGARLQAGTLLSDTRVVGLYRTPIAITDHRGRTLAGGAQANEEAFAGTARAAVASSRIQAVIDGLHITLAVPIVIAATGQAEGALVVELPLAGLLPPRRAGGDTVLAAMQPPAMADRGALRHQHPVPAPPPLDALGLVLHSAMPSAAALRPASTQLGVQLVAAAIAAAAAALLCRALARRLTEPVRALAEAAMRIGATGDHRLALPLSGSDEEVGRLAAAMHGMLRELGAAREHLEEQVRQRTAALAASEQQARRLAMVAERTDNAVAVTDMRGHVDWCNAGFSRLTGWRLDEVRGRSPGSFLQCADTDPATIALLRDAVDNQRGIKVEILNRHRAGHTYWIELEIQPIIAADGTCEGFMSIENDITARRALLADLSAAKEAAEAASRAKSAFLANMSHEIRTPMNGVLGLAELLLASDLSPACRELAQSLHRSGEALLVILNDILDFSKVEAGRLELERIPFDLNDLVHDVAELFRARIAGAGISLLVDADPSMPHHLLGDPGRLRQVLANLVGNAAKFTGHGRILLRAAAAHADDGRVALQLAVEDTGSGIPPERLGQLFQPFTQADASTARRFGGTGLGLAICRRLIELMGGTIEVSSQPGLGTAFRIRLSLAAAEPTASHPPRALRGLTVAIAGAEADATAILRRDLAAAGVRVADEDADLVLVDLPPEAPLPTPAGGDGRPRLLLCTQPPADLPAGWGYLLRPARPRLLWKRLAALAGEGGAASGVRPAMAPPPPLRPFRALLAEDNAINRFVATGMITRLGGTVVVAEDGGAALAAWEREAFDLVLMDWQMPVLDGCAAAAAIRAAEAGSGRARIPIIAMTANAMAGDRETCLAAGMDDHLAKPLGMEVLRACLARWLPAKR